MFSVEHLWSKRVHRGRITPPKRDGSKPLAAPCRSRRWLEMGQKMGQKGQNSPGKCWKNDGKCWNMMEILSIIGVWILDRVDWKKHGCCSCSFLLLEAALEFSGESSPKHFEFKEVTAVSSDPGTVVAMLLLVLLLMLLLGCTII